MPSNVDLIKEATALAAGLELTIVTDGVNNKDLAALVKDLRAKAIDAGTATQADDAAAKKAEDDAAAKKAEDDAAAKSLPDFAMAMGKGLTTKRGILSDGDEVKITDVAGGMKRIKALIKAGYIVNNR